MPFKIELKCSKQDKFVVTKTSSVICRVELLDKTTVECALISSDKITGKQCRDQVCHKLNLKQSILFGLRFEIKPRQQHPTYKWVDLRKPLKKQLHKFALTPNCLQLRVMYYVTGLSLLSDEITRYHYFLQIKSDVIEGRIWCSVEQAVLLAGYSMQAEFGDYKSRNHTAQCLKDFALFPMHFILQVPEIALKEAAILQHCFFKGLANKFAEEFYILSAQTLEGYGQQNFIGKDNLGHEVLLGISHSGLTVEQSKGYYYENYYWEEIANVVYAKRGLLVEGQRKMGTYQLNFASSGLSKYIWQLCKQQYKFFQKYSGDHKLQDADEPDETKTTHRS